MTRARWIFACATGEALGIAAVATAYAAGGRGLVPEIPAILAAGAWEGLALGGAQALVMARLGLAPGRWVGATIAAAVLGYGLSILGGAGSGGEAADAAEPGLATILGLGAAMGAAMGVMMGAAQLLAAGGLLRPVPWLWRNGLGWALAMAIIFAGAALAQEGWPLAWVAGLGLGSGAVAGALLGWATAPAVPVARPKKDRSI